MAKHVNEGDCIECNQSRIAVRKVSSLPTLLNIPGIDGINRRLHKYKTKIHAIVQIAQELQPKNCTFCNSAYLDLNDELEGDTIEIFIDGRIKFELVSNFSHVHGIQGTHVNKFTYAQIVLPFRFVLERGLPRSQILLA